MRDLAQAFALVFVMEGLFYGLAPEKAQAMMRELADLTPDALRKAGLVVAAIGVVWIVMIRR